MNPAPVTDSGERALYSRSTASIEANIAVQGLPLLRRPSAVFHFLLIFGEVQVAELRSRFIQEAKNLGAMLMNSLEALPAQAFQPLLGAQPDVLFGPPSDSPLTSVLEQWSRFYEHRLIYPFFQRFSGVLLGRAEAPKTDAARLIQDSDQIIARLNEYSREALARVERPELRAVLLREVQRAEAYLEEGQRGTPVWREVLDKLKLKPADYEDKELNTYEYSLHKSGFEVLRVQQDYDTGVVVAAWPTKLDMVQFCEKLQSFLEGRRFSPDEHSRVMVERYLRPLEDRAFPDKLYDTKSYSTFLGASEIDDLLQVRVCTAYADFCYQRPAPGEAGTAVMAIITSRPTRELFESMWHGTTVENLMSQAIYPSCKALQHIPEK